MVSSNLKKYLPLMSYPKKILFSLVIFILWNLMSCKSGQFSPAFKPLKQETEIVAIFSPYVENLMNDYTQQVRDTKLDNVNTQLISRISKNSISSCFTIKDVALSHQDLISFSFLYSERDTSEEFTKSILDKIFMKYSGALGKSTMAVFISYYGEYPLPEEKIIKDKIMNDDMIVPSTRPYSDMQIFAFDIRNREIVFYDRIATKMYSPDVYEDVVSMLQKIIRPICAKKIE